MVALLEEVTLCSLIEPPYGYSIYISSVFGLKLTLSVAKAKLFPSDKYVFDSGPDLQPRSQTEEGLPSIQADIYRGLCCTAELRLCDTHSLSVLRDLRLEEDETRA